MVGLVVEDEETGTGLELAEYPPNHLPEIFRCLLLPALCVELPVKGTAFVTLERSWLKRMVVGDENPRIQIAQPILPTPWNEETRVVIVLNITLVLQIYEENTEPVLYGDARGDNEEAGSSPDFPVKAEMA